MVASDRLSAFDVVLGQSLTGKGILLTRMSNFWFRKLAAVCPNHLTGIKTTYGLRVQGFIHKVART